MALFILHNVSSDHAEGVSWQVEVQFEIEIAFDHCFGGFFETDLSKDESAVAQSAACRICAKATLVWLALLENISMNFQWSVIRQFIDARMRVKSGVQGLNYMLAYFMRQKLLEEFYDKVKK